MYATENKNAEDEYCPFNTLLCNNYLRKHQENGQLIKDYNVKASNPDKHY